MQNLFHNIRRSRVDNWGELANRYLLIVCKYSSIKIHVGRVNQIDSGASWFQRWGGVGVVWHSSDQQKILETEKCHCLFAKDKFLLYYVKLRGLLWS